MLAQISPSIHSSSLSRRTGPPSCRTSTRRNSAKVAGSRHDRWAEPSLMIRALPSWVRPQPSLA